MENGTASIPGWYITFQQAVLAQLPRDIDQITAEGWTDNQKGLKNTLWGALLPQYFGTIVDTFEIKWLEEGSPVEILEKKGIFKSWSLNHIFPAIKKNDGLTRKIALVKFPICIPSYQTLLHAFDYLGLKQPSYEDVFNFPKERCKGTVVFFHKPVSDSRDDPGILFMDVHEYGYRVGLIHLLAINKYSDYCLFAAVYKEDKKEEK